MTPESENWGGKRKGAGRPLAAHVTARVKLPREVWAVIEADARRAGRSPEEEAARVLESHAMAPLFGIMQK